MKGMTCYTTKCDLGFSCIRSVIPVVDFANAVAVSVARSPVANVMENIEKELVASGVRDDASVWAKIYQCLMIH
jgi:hypothetical protein